MWKTLQQSAGRFCLCCSQNNSAVQTESRQRSSSVRSVPGHVVLEARPRLQGPAKTPKLGRGRRVCPHSLRPHSQRSLWLSRTAHLVRALYSRPQQLYKEHLVHSSNRSSAEGDVVVVSLSSPCSLPSPGLFPQPLTWDLSHCRNVSILPLAPETL